MTNEASEEPAGRAGRSRDDRAPAPVRCHVYRSSVREGLYVYVGAPDEGDALAALPPPVLRQLGRPALAMTIELDEHRRLGQEDVREVLANLAGQGFHVQMPRDIEPLVEAIATEAVAGAARRAPPD